LQALSEMADKEEQKAKALEKLKALDKDGSGYLEKAEIMAGMKEIFSETDMKLTDEDCTRMMDLVDANSDGKINIDEFLNMI